MVENRNKIHPPYLQRFINKPEILVTISNILFQIAFLIGYSIGKLYNILIQPYMSQEKICYHGMLGLQTAII